MCRTGSVVRLDLAYDRSVLAYDLFPPNHGIGEAPSYRPKDFAMAPPKVSSMAIVVPVIDDLVKLSVELGMS